MVRGFSPARSTGGGGFCRERLAFSLAGSGKVILSLPSDSRSDLVLKERRFVVNLVNTITPLSSIVKRFQALNQKKFFRLKCLDCYENWNLVKIWQKKFQNFLKFFRYTRIQYDGVGSTMAESQRSLTM